MMRLLQKVFVGQFYKLNIGFFAVVYFLFFGLGSLGDILSFHYSFMSSITYDSRAIACLFTIWLLYALKCFGFCMGILHKHEATFLYELQSLRNSCQLYTLTVLQICLYFPALLYAIVTTIVLWSGGNHIQAGLLLLFQVMIMVIPALIYRRALNSVHIIRWWRGIAGLSTKRFSFWLLNALLYSRKKSLISVKIFSLILLQLLLAYNQEELSLEGVYLVMLAVGLSHSILSYYLFLFTKERLRFLQALPIPASRVFGCFILTYVILLIPELLFLLLHFNSTVPVLIIAGVYVTFIALLSLFTAVSFKPGLTVERYIFIVFLLFFLSLAALIVLPLWLFILSVFLVASVLFFIFFPSRDMA